MSSVSSMTQFKEYFGPDRVEDQMNMIFGMYTVGQVCGFFPSIVMPDYLGRRWSMFIGNVLLMIGALIGGLTSGHNMSMFIGGRWLVGFGCTLASNAS